LRQNWLLAYLFLLLVRLAWLLHRPQGKPDEGEEFLAGLVREVKILGWVTLLAVSWYCLWKFFVPSVYVFYERYCLRSYAYLWNNRVEGFGRLAGWWWVLLWLYPLVVVLRIWRYFFKQVGRRSR